MTQNNEYLLSRRLVIFTCEIILIETAQSFLENLVGRIPVNTSRLYIPLYPNTLAKPRLRPLRSLLLDFQRYLDIILSEHRDTLVNR